MLESVVSRFSKEIFSSIAYEFPPRFISRSRTLNKKSRFSASSFSSFLSLSLSLSSVFLSFLCRCFRRIFIPGSRYWAEDTTVPSVSPIKGNFSISKWANFPVARLSDRMILYRSLFRAIETFHTGFPEPLAWPTNGVIQTRHTNGFYQFVRKQNYASTSLLLLLLILLLLLLLLLLLIPWRSLCSLTFQPGFPCNENVSSFQSGEIESVAEVRL